jgi:uncharacterized repeat protein (TIGR03803 family)
MRKLFTTALVLLVSISGIFAQYTKLYDFEGNSTSGSEPLAALVYDGSWFYSTTSKGGADDMGTVFKIKPDGTEYTLLHSFNGVDGERPASDLVKLGDYLFGTTSQSNEHNGCVIFKIKTDGTDFSIVHDFEFNWVNPTSISLGTDGNGIYGTTTGGDVWGFIFKLDSEGNNYSVIYDFGIESLGRLPEGELVPIGDELFGCTSLGGTNGNGVIYKINPDGSGYTKIFDNIENGISALITDGTYLYGYSLYGGTSYPGLIFKIKADGTDYSVIKELGEEGSGPSGYLTLHNNKLYGMSYDGPGNGSLFSLDTDGQNFEMFYECEGVFFTEDGERPIGEMIFIGNTLYGLMQLGGENDKGTMYKYSFATNVNSIPSSEELQLFPNPANNILNFKSDKCFNSIEVFDLVGSLVFTQHTNSVIEFSIDISDFVPGIYSVVFNNENGIKVIRNFTKM